MPFYELAREYGEARGRQEELRNACLALTKAKAPRLVADLERYLGGITDPSSPRLTTTTGRRPPP
jgi:hypothetical protein